MASLFKINGQINTSQYTFTPQYTRKRKLHNKFKSDKHVKFKINKE